MPRFLNLIGGCSYRQDGKVSFDHQDRILSGQGSWVRTTLEISGLQVKPSASGTYPFLLTLGLEELEATDWNSGRKPKSSTNTLQLTFEIEGKEQALFSGLIGRSIRVLGYNPGWSQSLETLVLENQDLKTRLEEIQFQLSQLGLISTDKGSDPKLLES